MLLVNSHNFDIEMHQAAFIMDEQIEAMHRQVVDESISEQNSTSHTKEIDTTTEQVTHEPTSISKEESADVRRFKLIVIIVLLIVAISVSTCVYMFISKTERSHFEQKFQDDASKVLEAVRISIDNTLIPLDALAVSLVSHAKTQNDTWPFVTLPDYGVRIGKVLPLTDAVSIIVLPVVSPENRLRWEEYSRTHDDWFEHSISVQESWEHYFGPRNISFEIEFSDFISGDEGPIEANVSRLMLPEWQSFPIPDGISAYNYDWLSITSPESPLACYSSRRSILSESYLIPEPDNPDVLIEANFWIDYYKYFIGPGEDPYEPIMDILYPIVNDISRIKNVASSNDNATNDEVVGVIAATAYWRNIIRNTLPPGSNGITVVFSNECTKSFTYEINGPDVVFIGVNDKHETEFDRMQVSSKITDLEKISFVASVYSGAPINEDHCPYTLHLYPTKRMKLEFTSNSAGIFTSVTLIVAIGLGVLFLTYDLKVERRQKKVLESAVRSSEIVSSLFPDSVRDQLYPTAGNEPMQSSPQWSMQSKSDENETKPVAGGPIAKLYPETTVMFADIKGFTQWSASRGPTQVFHLLETIYGSFDAVAREYGVFKVETIGDTYVAVIGLPNGRKHHAVTMVRFATKCLEKLTVMTRELESILGSGTAELSLRVGLNSGPTTAGVLRGEKARFQLFGDTVNTASRMESNGESNRIHVSEATAKQIEKDGKAHWLQLRDNEIEVKGKGTMQTYWCEISNRTIASSSSIPTRDKVSDDNDDGSVILDSYEA